MPRALLPLISILISLAVGAQTNNLQAGSIHGLILTSEGKNRAAADGTKARWVVVQGSLDSDYGGAVMMSYPTNYNFPEPLRIWPENVVGNGDVYANFFPCRDKDWTLSPGQDYVLKYRFLVFNGKCTKEKAEAAWRLFAHPPKVTVKVLASK